MSVFCSRILPRYRVTFSYYSSLGFFFFFFDLWMFLRLFLFMVTLFWRLLIYQVFCRMSTSWDFSDVFHKMSGMTGFREEDHKVPFSSPYIKGTYYLCDLWLLMLISSPSWNTACLHSPYLRYFDNALGTSRDIQLTPLKVSKGNLLHWKCSFMRPLWVRGDSSRKS